MTSPIYPSPESQSFRFKIPAELEEDITEIEEGKELHIGSQIKDMDDFSPFVFLALSALSISSAIFKMYNSNYDTNGSFTISLLAATVSSLIYGVANNALTGLGLKRNREDAVDWCANASLSDLAQSYNVEKLIQYDLLKNVPLEIKDQRVNLYQAVNRLFDALQRMKNEKAELEKEIEEKYKANGGRFEDEFTEINDFDDEEPNFLQAIGQLGVLLSLYGRADRERHYEEWKAWKDKKMAKVTKKYDRSVQSINNRFNEIKEKFATGQVYMST